MVLSKHRMSYISFDIENYPKGFGSLKRLINSKASNYNLSFKDFIIKKDNDEDTEVNNINNKYIILIEFNNKFKLDKERYNEWYKNIINIFIEIAKAVKQKEIIIIEANLKETTGIYNYSTYSIDIENS